MSSVVALVLIGASVQAAGLGGEGQSYPMDKAHWQTTAPIGWAGRVAGAATFARDEGIPSGTMTLNEGIATLGDGAFAQGQIDLDIKPLGYSDAGILFRLRDDDGEFVYVRANPDCPAAQDCVQYAPVTNGLMGWNIYPNYQASAPINTTSWNHLTIRVAGDRMQVFVNRAAEPVLTVPRLLGLTSQGGIALKGPAVYANMVVRSGSSPAMVAVAQPAAAPGVIEAWLAAPPTATARPQAVGVSDLPAEGAWHPIEVEPTGLVDLGRAFGAAHAPSLSVGWLKTVIDSPVPRRAFLHAGFAMQMVAFVNGQPVFRGNNPYYPEQARLSPGGRIGFDNAAISVDLKRGRNEIVLAVGNDWRADLLERHPSHYGWAAEARLDDDPSNAGGREPTGRWHR